MSRVYEILRASGHRLIPWKNGLGMTTEIAIQPPGATFDTFDWRLSMARIDTDSAFSRFPDVDRLLMMLEGNIELSIEGDAPFELGPDDPAVPFRGEAAVEVHLPGPPALDLNLMIRRGRYAPHMQRLKVGRKDEIISTADVMLLLCRSDGVRVRHEQGETTLDRDDVLSMRGRGRLPLQIEATQREAALLYAVELQLFVHTKS